MPELSNNAIRLLAVLRAHAPARTQCKTDRQLAALAHLPERDIIDAAGELLAAGYFVLASSGAPAGRWLTDDAAAARRYSNDLGKRAVRIWRRRKDVRTAIERRSLIGRIGINGQGNLFGSIRN